MSEPSVDLEITAVLRQVNELASTLGATGDQRSAELLDDAADHLRRARFHERENFASWQEAETDRTVLRNRTVYALADEWEHGWISSEVHNRLLAVVRGDGENGPASAVEVPVSDSQADDGSLEVGR